MVSLATKHMNDSAGSMWVSSPDDGQNFNGTALVDVLREATWKIQKSVDRLLPSITFAATHPDWVV